MADPLFPMTLGVGASLVKVLLQANGYATEANSVGVAKEVYGILSWWKIRGGDADDQLAKQIAEVLADKTRGMYEECRAQGIDEEQLGGVVTEVEIIFNKVVGNDELLFLAVNDPDSFSEVLQGDIGQRRKNIESRLEPYFDKLVEAAVDEYVKLAPWSPKFQIEALKDLINKADEILKNTVKCLENDEIIIAGMGYVTKGIDVLLERGAAEVASNVSVREPVIFGVRPDVAAFYIERGERARLHDLAIERQQPRIVLSGMRGCGKSQLASDLAQWCEKQEWSLVAWINAASRESVQSDLVELAQRLPIDRSDKPTQDQLINRCLDYFKSANATDRLIIFDNVEDINHLTGLVPRGDGLRVVATTTNEYGWKNQSWKPIKIGVFSREDSIKCLLRITDSEDSEAADAVAQKLGDLPLAIAQAGATACAEGFTLNEYLTCLDDYSSRSGHGDNEIIRPIDGDSYTDGAFDALFMAANVALNKLGDSLYEVGRRQLGGLALLAQSGVPTRWIAPLPDDNRRALTRLVNMSVVQQSVDKNVTMLHRLQAQVLRANWGKEKTATCEEAFDAAVEILGRTKYEQLPSEATHARRRETSDLIAQLSAIAVQDYSRSLFEREQVRGYLNRAFKYGHDLGIEYKTVELSAAVGVIEDVLGPDHPVTLTVRNNLAGAYKSAGRLAEAIELFKQVLDERERVLEADHPDTLTVRNNLASAYESVGRFGEAIELFKQVLAERERVLGADHPDTLTVRNNLAGAYESVGRFGEAIELYEQVLAERERVLGADHPDTLNTRNNLAVAYYSVGRFGEAIELYEQVLAERERVLEADHPDTLTVRNNLASAYESVGRFGEAIDAWEELLLDCQRVLGADHPVTLTVRNNLAVAYRSVGRFGEAIELFEQVLADRVRVLGPDHPDTLTTRHNLASAYGDVGRFGEAIELFEQVLADRVRVLGPDHPNTLTVRNNLAGAYYSVGRFGEAVELFEQVLAEYERVLGADHPDTLTTRNNLALAYKSVGRFGEAIELFEQVLAERERVLGADHLDTLNTRNSLAGAYDSVGRLADAIDAWEELLPDCQRVLGADHPDTLGVRNNLAVAYDSVGRLAEAIDAWEELLPDCQRVLGADHPDTLGVRNNLAVAYDSVGRLAEAIDAWEELLPDCQRVLGLEHPLTKQVRKILKQLNAR